MVTGLATGYDTIEDKGGDDTIIATGGNDLIISRDGGDIITLGGDGSASISTVRVYPTHEKDHVYGRKTPGNTRTCTKINDVWEETSIELVMDDPWYPDTEYTNEDDFCSTLVHGWELAWYWDMDGWNADAGTNPVDVWFSRSTGEASLYLSVADTTCRGPGDMGIV